MSPWLSQSKSYLKIIGISYLMENTNVSINSNMVKSIIKNTYIFNNVTLTSKLRVINVGNFIATIQGTNMNPKIL